MTNGVTSHSKHVGSLEKARHNNQRAGRTLGNQPSKRSRVKSDPNGNNSAGSPVVGGETNSMGCWQQEFHLTTTTHLKTVVLTGPF
jgi:hypothetical protein